MLSKRLLINKINTTWQTKKLKDCIEKVKYTEKIQRKEFLEFGNFPIVSQESDFINGYWNNKKDLFQIKTPVIIFGDHTQVLKYIDFNFVLGADGVKILQPKKNLNTKYFYYFLQSINLKRLGYARHYRLLEEVEISYPESLSAQKRIVKVLDKIFEGIDKSKKNTEKNLENSRELFESYLQSIFSNPGKGWEEKKLVEIIKLEYGKPLNKIDRNENGKFPVYGANGEKDRTNRFYYDKQTIIVGRKGSAGELNLTENKFWPLDVTYFVVFDRKKYNLKFIYFLLSTLKLTKLAKGVKPGINRNDVYCIFRSKYPLNPL